MISVGLTCHMFKNSGGCNLASNSICFFRLHSASFLACSSFLLLVPDPLGRCLKIPSNIAIVDSIFVTKGKSGSVISVFKDNWSHFPPSQHSNVHHGHQRLLSLISNITSIILCTYRDRLGSSGSIKAIILSIIPHHNPDKANTNKLTPMSIRLLFIMFNSDACPIPQIEILLDSGGMALACWDKRCEHCSQMFQILSLLR